MWKKDWIYTVMAIFLVSLIFIGAILEAVDEHARKLEEGVRFTVMSEDYPNEKDCFGWADEYSCSDESAR